MSSLFYRNRRLFSLVVFLMVAASLSAVLTIGRQEDPTITNIYASIATAFPGADPSRVETLVTEKIENRLRAIAEVEDIVSVSRIGVSLIHVKLSEYIGPSKILETWSEIRNALTEASRTFPEGAQKPEFETDRSSSFSSIAAIMSSSASRPNETIAHRYAEILQNELRNIKGTKYVEIFGEREEEIQVLVDAKRLASMGFTIDAVSDAIARADAKVRAGQVRGDSNDLLIEVSGELDTLARVIDVSILEGEDGRIVRVGDIATVRRGVRQPVSTLALVDGREAFLVAAATEDDIQVNAWSDDVKASYEKFRSELPAGLELRSLFDQASYTDARLHKILTNMLVGIIIVVGVLYFTLGLRAAIVVGLTIPLAASVSIVGLQICGVSIHQMSVTGLIVALGLLVDSAIVVNDDIHRRLRAGASRLQAVEAAVQRLALPLLASTLTTVLAFMPMVLLPGPTGDFVGSIAISVIIMLSVSFILALTLTPALAGWVLDDGCETARNRPTAIRKLTDICSQRLRALVEDALRKPRRAIAVALIFPVIGFGAYPALKLQFFPGVDRNQFYVQLKMPEGSAIKETRRQVQAATKVIRTEPGVSTVAWVMGGNAPAFYYNMLSNQHDDPGFAEALITTASADATEEMLDRLQRKLGVAVPDARITVRGLVQGPPVNAPLEIRVVGQELATLKQIGDNIRRMMLDVPGVVQVTTELSPGAPKLFVDLEEEKVKLAGLDLGSAARQLETLTEGVIGGSVVEGSEELPVRVRADMEGKSTIDRVLTLDLLGEDARRLAATGLYPGIPISALGKISVRPTETPIHRLNGERINTVQGFVKRDVLPEVALRSLKDRLIRSGVYLPDGYRLEIGGDADARSETLRNLMSSAGVLICLAIATIVISLRSYRLAAITIVVAILSLGLSLLALSIFGYPFGIQAVIGVIGSIGVSINAAIILMTAMQRAPGANAGDITQILNVTIEQSRHIVSTTLTTVGGFLPLLLEGGGFWPPFAMSIAGGVLLSSIVTFFFVPPAFLLFSRNGNANSRPKFLSMPVGDLLSSISGLRAKSPSTLHSGPRNKANENAISRRMHP